MRVYLSKFDWKEQKHVAWLKAYLAGKIKESDLDISVPSFTGRDQNRALNQFIEKNAHRFPNTSKGKKTAALSNEQKFLNNLRSAWAQQKLKLNGKIKLTFHVTQEIRDKIEIHKNRLNMTNDELLYQYVGDTYKDVEGLEESLEQEIRAKIRSQERDRKRRDGQRVQDYIIVQKPEKEELEVFKTSVQQEQADQFNKMNEKLSSLAESIDLMMSLIQTNSSSEEKTKDNIDAQIAEPEPEPEKLIMTEDKPADKFVINNDSYIASLLE